MKQFFQKIGSSCSTCAITAVILVSYSGAIGIDSARGQSVNSAAIIAPMGEKRWQYVAVHMGVPVKMTVYASDEERAQSACRAAFARVAQIDDIASDWRPDSELMRLCRHFDSMSARALRVSAELFTMLDFSRKVSQHSGGLFDVSVGPLVSLWRQTRRTRNLPPKSIIRNARRLVDWHSIKLNQADQTVQLLKPGMRLDLGGVAKGFAGDEALKVLWSHDVRRALIEAGGDIIAGDAPPNSDGWKIELLEGRVISLANGALSTSGDSEQWVEIGGRRYSHVVDIRSGLGLTTRYAATVRAPSGLMSDALSTAASLVGPRRAKRLSKYFAGTTFEVRRVMPPSSDVSR